MTKLNYLAPTPVSHSLPYRTPFQKSVLEPWLPGCRVLPDRVAGLPGRCRVRLPGCRGQGSNRFLSLGAHSSLSIPENAMVIR